MRLQTVHNNFWCHCSELCADMLTLKDEYRFQRNLTLNKPRQFRGWGHFLSPLFINLHPPIFGGVGGGGLGRWIKGGGSFVAALPSIYLLQYLALADEMEEFHSWQKLTLKPPIPNLGYASEDIHHLVNSTHFTMVSCLPSKAGVMVSHLWPDASVGLRGLKADIVPHILMKILIIAQGRVDWTWFLKGLLKPV